MNGGSSETGSGDPGLKGVDVFTVRFVAEEVDQRHSGLDELSLLLSCHDSPSFTTHAPLFTTHAPLIYRILEGVTRF